jgi:ribose transport system ATP-binding protein
VKALRGAALTVRPGEIHGLVGENGSGKSTLIKLLAGFHVPDEPTPIVICGQSSELPLKPGEAARLGIAFVHQDLGLIPEVSVLENLLIEEFATESSWYLSRRRLREKGRQILAGFDLDLDLDATTGQLRPTDRALLAIARAAASISAPDGDGDDGRRGLLVLDEPTVYLPEHDRQRLFALMRSVAATGVGIIFVSHDVDEVLTNSQSVTVMRDGQVAGTVESSETSPEGLITLILGRALAQRTNEPPPVLDDGSVIQVSGLRGGAARDLSLEMRRGEILGVTGLPGAGFDDIPYLLFGAKSCEAGRLRVGGVDQSLAKLTPDAALDLGVALIPADRPGAGAVGSLSVAENVTLQVIHRYRRGPFLSRRKMIRAAEEVAEEFDVRPRDPRADYASLSGGNQQKVLLAKWFLTEPQLLLLHEPTQGVDVGAREEIFALLRRAATEGCAIVIASSDHEQLAAVCHTVAIIRSGRVGRRLRGSEIRQDVIGEACYADPDPSEAVA